MTVLKRILAIVALLCAAFFVGACIILTIAGTIGQQLGWVLLPMTLFLMLGLLCLLLNYLEKRAHQAKESAAEKEAQL